MQCPGCHAENRDGLKFCEDCGIRLAVTCASCGADVTPGKRFCGSCGEPLGSITPDTRFTSPQSYTPKHLAERILTSKSSLEGERKQVTVLFADLKGSMELLADRDPEDARRILDPVLELMMEAVHRYEGTVNQVMGDGIMALFGAPIAHEDHAVRASYTALRMQDAVKRYAEAVRREEGATIRIRVGLNSGEVVVRSIGSDLRMDYTAVGQTTHLAARMEQLAEPGTAFLTSATLALCEDFVQVKSLGPMRVKGRSDAVEVYELVGANPVRSRFQAHATRGLTKFVGRASEMSQLDEAVNLAKNGRGQVVAVVGEAGVGKSRLFWEFVHSHRVHGCLVVEAASVSYGKATTYLPVIELLHDYFQIELRDDTRKIREKVTGKLFSLNRALEPALPALLALLDVPVDDEEWTGLDPAQRRQRTLDAVTRLLLCESGIQPLVVIFEDLHWIDGETKAVLDSLIESLPSADVLLLVNYRPEYHHAWGAKPYYRQMRIDALPPASAEELLQALLGSDPGLEPLKRLLIERTDGNPFFLEETAKTLVETKVLTGERGGYRLAKALDVVQAPATVQAVLAARIDRLPPEDKQLLQAASVIGKDLSFAVLQMITGESEGTLRRRLTQLQTADFLYETNLFPDLEYTFKHALTHEVAYGSVLQEVRRELHAQIVEALERLYPDRLADLVGRLGDHALRGGVWDKAARYLREAGVRAARRSAHREAVTALDSALAAVGRLPRDRGTIEQAIDVRIDLRNSPLLLGEHSRISDLLQEAEALAVDLKDEHRLGWVSTYLSHSFWYMGDPDRAIAAGERALKTGAGGDELLKTLTHFHLGQVHHSLGDYRRASGFLRSATDGLESAEARERFGVLYAVRARSWLVWCLAELGEFPEGIVQGKAGLRIAETVDEPFSLITAEVGLGGLYLRRGDLTSAIAALERALAVSRNRGLPVLFPTIAS